MLVDSLISRNERSVLDSIFAVLVAPQVSSIAICTESLQEQNNRAGDAIVLMLVLVAFHGILQMAVEQIVDLFDPLSVSERNLLVFDLLAPLQIMMSSLMLCKGHGKHTLWTRTCMGMSNSWTCHW